MASKLSFLIMSKKIPKWVRFDACYLSTSCATTVEIITEADENRNNQLFRNNLHPYNLVQALDATSDLNAALKLFKWAALQKNFRHTAETYLRMLLKLGLAGKIDEMEGFCQNMLRDRFVGVEKVFILLIDSLVENGRLEEARRILVNMTSCSGDYKPPIDTYNVVLGALVRHKKDFQNFLFVYKEMVKSGIAPNVNTLNYLLEILFHTGRVESALNQFRRMNKKFCNPDSRTFEIVIRCLIEIDRVDDSVVILNEMIELPFMPEPNFFSCIIPLLCRENRFEDAVRLFNLMRELNCVPDSVVYKDVIKYLCRNLQLVDVSKFLKDMSESRVKVDDHVCDDIINMFCNSGKFEEALSFLKDGCSFTTSPYNAMLVGCYNAGKLGLAMTLFKTMCEKNIADCDSWNVLIRWFCETMDVRKASELLGRMITFSVLPDSATLSAFVIGNCRLRKFDNAFKLFCLIQSKCWILDYMSYAELIKGFCEVAKVNEAVDILHYMSENGCSLEPTSFTILIKNICTAGKVDVAIKLVLVGSDSGTCCNTETYAAVIRGLSKSGRSRDLLVVISRMVVVGCSLGTEVYCSVIQSMSEVGRFEVCTLFFNSMINEGLVPDMETTRSLLGCLARHSQLHLVSDAILKVISSHEIMDSAMYSLLIDSLWKEGFRNKAGELLDLMLEKNWIPDARTHSLFVGTATTTENVCASALAYENHSMQDNVSDILTEGLGEAGEAGIQ